MSDFTPPRGAVAAHRAWSALIGNLAVIAGAIAVATSDCAPTGHRAFDVVLLAVLGALTTWAGWRAPWWLVGIVADVAAAVSPSSGWLMVGLVGVALGAAAGRWADHGLEPWAIAVALTVLSRQHLGGFLGSSVVVAVVTCGSLTIVGLVRRGPTVRRRALCVSLGVAAVVVLAGVGLGVAASGAKSDLQAANQQARDGIKALKDGRFADAQTLLGQASASFAAVQHDLDRPWVLPSALVPVLSQHRELGMHLTKVAQQVADAAGKAAQQIDPEQLKLVNGHIDVAAVQAVVSPLEGVQTALASLGVEVNAKRSPWIVSPIRTKLTSLADDLNSYQDQAARAVAVAKIAPSMLGSGGARRYFVAFTTPAEVRGVGGFMGNYAIMTVDQGKISMSEFGRSDTLVTMAKQVASLKLPVSSDFLNRYGRFGFADATTGLADPEAWKNVTMSPDFHTTASVIAAFYAASGGQPVDGVVLMDPYAIQALLGFTGPVQVPGAPKAISKDNAAQFILKDQYAIAKDERVDLLTALAQSTFASILGGKLPAPVDMAKTLSPLTRQDRLMIWSAHPDEQKVLDTLQMSGHFPVGAGDTVAIALDNAAANKMEAYLTRTVTTKVEPQPTTGDALLTVTVQLHNGAPASGLPDYVAGGILNLPKGSSYLYVVAYAPWDLLSETHDGQLIGTQTDTELGLQANSAYISLTPGASTTLVMTYRLPAVRKVNVYLPPIATP